MRVFREQAWCEEDLRLSAASVVVRISQPAIAHRVKISDFEAWLASSGKSPAEMSLKSRLRDIIERLGQMIMNHDRQVLMRP